MSFEYETVSDDYISRTLHEGLSSVLYAHCYNLSTILGDTNGKLNPTTVQQLVNSISIVSPGIVLSGYTDSTGEVEDSLLGNETYVNEVTSSAHALFAKLQEGDPSVVITGSSSVRVASPLIRLSHNISPLITTAIIALYLDTFSLYTELLKCTPTTNIPITRQDLYKMDGNLRWISANLENMEYRIYDLIEVIRQLQRTLMGIRNLNQVFTTTYVSKINSIGFIEEV